MYKAPITPAKNPETTTKRTPSSRKKRNGSETNIEDMYKQPKKEQYKIPPGYIRTSNRQFKDVETRLKYKHPPGYSKDTKGLYVSESDN